MSTTLQLLPQQEINFFIICLKRFYDVFVESHRNLVFQDMKPLGFITANREIGLDEHHLEVALKKIAMFHAASIELLRKVKELTASDTILIKNCC